MNILEILQNKINGLDGQDYAAYQSIKGKYEYPSFTLIIDQIPKDPYAPPHTGVYRGRVSLNDAGITNDMITPDIRKVALRDYVGRVFYEKCCLISRSRRGTGNSGLITIAKPSQAILDRSSIVINDDYIEVRFFIGLPAEGRKISSSTAVKMLFEELPKIIDESLYIKNISYDSLYEHLKVAEDAEYLRGCLNSRDMIGFIANGSVLPRESGIDERPLLEKSVVKFRAPESMEVEFDLPNRGKIKGMAIYKGVTLIVGGGYHGKSTVLNALQLGIYNHIPGDGREFCVSIEEAVKVRASSGRYVSNVDISPFLSAMPHQLNTTSFSTLNASGSTSQASTIIESIEAGGRALLMDEDTCAANFMIRDKRMQELIPKKDEPITSFIDCIKTMFTSRGISTLLVMGGSGDYFDVADRVVWMKEFLPYDVTNRAHLVAREFPTGRRKELLKDFSSISNRCPLGDKIDPRNEYGKIRISSPDLDKLVFGVNTVDLSDVEQLVESTQIKGIGLAINSVIDMMDGSKTIKSIVEDLSENINSKGIDLLDKNLIGDIAGFRAIDLAATLNRMRSLQIKTLK